MQGKNYLGSEEELIIVVKSSKSSFSFTALKMLSYCTENIEMLADTEISTKLC